MRCIMSKVAIVKCENYLPNVVLSAVKKAVDLIGIDLKKELHSSKNVLIKPNLCNNSDPEDGITTHPEVIKAIIRLLGEINVDILIGDNSVGRDDPKHLDMIYKTCGIDDIIEEFGCEKNYLNTDIKTYTCQVDGKELSFYLSKKILETSFIINVPKFKTHSLMTFTGSIKNLYGMIPGNTKRKLHVELPDKQKFAQLLVNLCDMVQPGLNILDAVVGIEGNGPSKSGIKRKIGYIMASENAVALDIVASMMMGIDYMQVPTNAYAVQHYGLKNVHDYIQILGEPIEECIIPDLLLPNTVSYNDHITEKIFSLSTPKLYIENDKCKKCMMCYNNCPKSAIYFRCENKLEINASKCISCMICMEICPHSAIVSKLPKIYKQLRAMRDEKV